MSRTTARNVVAHATMAKYDIFPITWVRINLNGIFFRLMKHLEFPLLAREINYVPHFGNIGGQKMYFD